MGASPHYALRSPFQTKCGFILPVHFFMATDIQQDDFLVGNGNGQGDTIPIGDADGLNVFELAAEVVVGKMGGKGILR